MIDVHEAKRIAERHLAENPMDHPYYRWKVADSEEREDGWYFDYSFECSKDIPAEERDGVGGAPGFLVRKADGSVVDVSWSEWFSWQEPPTGQDKVSG